MRERVTFVHGSQEAFDPSQLRIEKDGLHIASLKAAREDRLTFGFQELPQELWRALRQCHELHIRWSAATPYPLRSPFNSRISPGLHIFYTPQKSQKADLVCPLLKKIFGDVLKCASPEETFTAVPVLSERFASSSAFQYYQLLPSLGDFLTYVTQKICSSHEKACLPRAAALFSADYVDIDFDTISQALVIKAFRHQPAGTETWNDHIQRIGDSRIEVGVLADKKSTEPESLSMGGSLTVLGEDDKTSPTLFEFPARHHETSQLKASTYTAHFIPPTGLHPTLRLSFPALPEAPPAESCVLHSYLTLPSTLFPDKYQLSAPLFLASKNLGPICSVSGETDLEAPDWAIEKWGSSMLIELAPPKDNTGGSWSADIPLHLRYLPPAPGGHAYTDIPWPIVFWACRAEDGSKMNANPFDRVNLGYDGLFGTKTMFYHLTPNASSGEALVERLDVPVLDSDKTAWLSAGTSLVVGLGLLWVLGAMISVALGQRKAVGEQKAVNKKTQ